MPDTPRFRLPHPLILLAMCIALAAALTWILPAGEFERREDPATGRNVVVAGTYHAVARAPVGPFAAVVAIPRGFIEAGEVIVLVLLVGGAWFIIDRIGTLGRVVGALVGRLRTRGLVAIPVISIFFATMGAMENMQEEIIPLIPVLMVLGAGLGIDAVSVVAMSAGAAMIGSAFGPINPFQAGIAMKLAQLPSTTMLGLRLVMLVAAVALWIAWTMRYASRSRVMVQTDEHAAVAQLARKDVVILLIAVAPIFAYVYGSLALGWGLNELSGAFVVAAVIAGLYGGLGATGTLTAYLEGMQNMVPAVMIIALARTISLVLADGHVIDTMLQALATPLSHASPTVAVLLMIPAQALIHVVVPSVSGQAVLTMPVLLPLSDLLGIGRLVTVFAYQMGAGLCELLTPTNGALMAILLAAGVPYQKWIRFVVGGVAITLAVGVAGMLLAMRAA